MTVELRRGRSFAEDAERKASRIGGASLFALAGYVVGAGWSLWTGRGQDFSWPGLLVAVATLPIMRRHNAPRLRERRRLELSLANDARERTWPREVERHCSIARRIEQLLSDLGEEVE